MEIIQSAIEFLNCTDPMVRMDSQCKYAALSRGDAQLYLRLVRDPDFKENIWVRGVGEFGSLHELVSLFNLISTV
jgi:3'-phosphoadenosine 5'-phosphosulfate (PAPS) 3'-phosphatase